MMKFKNQLKRGLSMTVTLAMCMGTLQATALADDWSNDNVTTPSGDTVSVSGEKNDKEDGSSSWSGTSEDKSVSVSGSTTAPQDTEASVNPPESTPGDWQVDTNSNNVTLDEQGRPSTESGERTESQTTTTTTDTATSATETTTTQIVTELGEREVAKDKDGKDKVDVKPEELTSGDLENLVKDGLIDQTPETKYENVTLTEDSEVKVEFDVKPDGEWGTETEKVNTSLVFNEGRPGIEDLVSDAKDREGFERDDSDLKNDVWTKTENVTVGEKKGTKTIKFEVIPKNDECGNPYYSIVKTTTISFEGDFEGNTDGSIDFSGIAESPSAPVRGTEEDVSGDLPDPQLIGTVPEGADPIVVDGITVGYEIDVPVGDVVDPVTGATISETRKQQIFFTEVVTESVTTRVDTQTFTKEDTVIDKATETKKDEVTEVVEEFKKTLDISDLTVNMNMSKVEAEEGKLYNAELDKEIQVNPLDPYNNAIADLFKDEVVGNEGFTGASILVQQKECISNGAEGYVEVKLDLTKSKFDPDNFVLTVTRQHENGVNNFEPENETITLKDGKVTGGSERISYNAENGTIHIFGVGSEHIGLKLTARKVKDFDFTDRKDKLGMTSDDCLRGQVYKEYDLTTSINVEITEVKGEFKTEAVPVAGGDSRAPQYKQGTKTETTTTYERDRITTGTQTRVVETSITETVTQSTDRRGETWERNYTYASAPATPETPETPEAPVIPMLPGGGTGTTTGDTVTVADAPTPLAEAPVVDVPETEVPLAETPVEMEIPEEAVPLADVPAEVVIVDDAVPLAEVPKTGDISGLWYATAVLSLGGWMLVRGKKNEEDA